jgi:hypothetical protein
MASFTGANYNLVFSGVKGAPETHCGRDDNNGPYTTLWKTDIIAEKPYISVDEQDKWTLKVPKVEVNKLGATDGWRNADDVDFSQVFVANDNMTAQNINDALA